MDIQTNTTSEIICSLDEFCGREMQTVIEKLIKFHDSIEAEQQKPQCAICYDRKQKLDFTYLLCGHNICTSCYKKIIDAYQCYSCPFCRKYMHPITLSDKYAVICPGKTTDLYTFDNGGLISIYIFYFPNFNGVAYDIIEHITYHDENTERFTYVSKFIDLRCAGYCIAFRNFKKMTMWSNDMLLADLIPDIRYDLEKIRES